MVNQTVSSIHFKKVYEITPKLIKQAVCKLKPGKSDPIYSFSSDCFRNGPDSMYDPLSWIIKSSVVHNPPTL